jgi:hypothetical protein
MILRMIAARAQSGNQKRKDKAAAETFTQGYAVSSIDRDDEGVPPSYVSSPEFPQNIPVHPTGRLLQDTDIPLSRDTIGSVKESAKSGSGRTFPQNLDYLPPLKRAVVLAEIIGRPKGLEESDL